MKRVVLFYPSHKFGRSAQPRIELPQSLLTIASPLVREGYAVEIIDQRVDRNWRDNLSRELSKDPVCVGISSMTGPQIGNGLEASRLVRKNGNVPIIWGGIHPTLEPEQTVENENVDIVVQGEGEETFPELVSALADGNELSDVKGIWYKNNGRIQNTPNRPLIDLDKQAPLSYHLVDVNNYMINLFGRDHLSLEASRGCPNKCNYCYNTKVFKSTWRPLSIEKVIQRIRILVEEYGIGGIIFTDDNFFVNKKRAIQIFERIKEEKFGLYFSKLDGTSGVFSAFTDNELSLLKECGAKTIVMGIESGSPGMLKKLQKPTDIPRLLELNNRVKRFDILPIYFFMVGYPTETREELSQTVSLYFKLITDNKDAISHINIYTPFPGTGLYDVALENGFVEPENLQDWVPLNWRNVSQKSVWLSKRRKKIVRMPHFATLFTGQKIFINPYKKTNPLVKLLARIYHPIAKRRVEQLFYRFLVEIKIAEWLGLYPKQEC